MNVISDVALLYKRLFRTHESSILDAISLSSSGVQAEKFNQRMSLNPIPLHLRRERPLFLDKLDFLDGFRFHVFLVLFRGKSFLGKYWLFLISFF